LLIDFGIARSAAQTALTEAGFAPGTPGYTAPEVLLRNEVGPAADVFALGATLAHAATGRPPFGHGEPAGVSYRAVHEAIDLAGVEPRLAALIEACVAKDPAARPALADVIARCGVRTALVEDTFYGGLAALGEAVPQTPPAPASPAAPAPPSHPPLGPHDLPTASAAHSNGYGYTPTQVTRQTGVTSPRRKSWLIAGAAALAVTVGAVAALTLLPGTGNDKDKDGAAGAGATSAPPATTVGGDEPELQPPAYVEQTNPSRDFWTADPASAEGGACVLPAEERNEQFQASVAAAGTDDPYTSGKGTIGIRLKYATPQPYYVSVAVKPPHEIDADTGKPIEGMPVQNLDLGYTSKPVAVGTEWVYLTYPDDFEKIVKGEKYGDAIPVENDPGDWTVLFLHVEEPKKYASIYCRGFIAK
jgi:hypothetical protein